MLSNDNSNLLEKMEAIQVKKGGSELFGGPPIFKRRKKSEVVRAGSMNYEIRQKENDRIFKENQIIYNKIKSSQAHLKKSIHDEHYN